MNASENPSFLEDDAVVEFVVAEGVNVDVGKLGSKEGVKESSAEGKEGLKSEVDGKEGLKSMDAEESIKVGTNGVEVGGKEML